MPLEPFPSPAETETAAARFAASGLALARHFAEGGATWTVSRRSGNGVTGPVGAAATHTVTAYALRTRPVALGGDPAGVLVPIDQWQLYADAVADVGVGDEISSVAQPSLRFRVGTVSLRGAVLSAQLETR